MTEPADLLERIARGYGLDLPVDDATSHRGATGTVICTGDYAVKVARPGAVAREATMTGARVAAVASRAGIATPAVVLVDDQQMYADITVVVYRRVPGVPAEEVGRLDARLGAAWYALGEQLARIHQLGDEDGLANLRRFQQTPELDPRAWLASDAIVPHVPREDRDWFRATLDHVMPLVIASHRVAFCHGDVNASNMIVDAHTCVFRGLVDWSGAGWLDPAWDLARLPLAAVPTVLAGYRTVGPFPNDHSAEARILGVQLQAALHRVRVDPRAEPVDALQTKVQSARDFRDMYVTSWGG
ncbi:MAG TPA: aminoglycoside phosphotransferase family protein [Thermomicrobiales bacterium]|nr:aminoglycoside phosphotransferase family protein [Thermomicrobiales bacterium]